MNANARKINSSLAKSIVELSVAGTPLKEIVATLQVTPAYAKFIRWSARQSGVNIPHEKRQGGGNAKWQALGART